MREPNSFGEAGQEFWTETMANYALSDTETLLLARTCTILDTLTALDQAIADNGAMVEGKNGMVVNPAVPEARNQTIALHRTLSALKLPDLAGNPVQSARTTTARTAASARWSKGPASRPTAG